jgi:MGT family glycosyltransferase
MNALRMVAKSLQRRGHHVVFAGMPDCRPVVEPYGFEFVPLYAKWFPEGLMSSWLVAAPAARSWRETLRFYLGQRQASIDHQRYVDHLIHGGHRELHDAVRSIDPDLILIDIDLHPYWAILAYTTGIRTMYVSSIFPTTEDPAVPPFTTTLAPAHDETSRREVRLAWRRYFRRRWLSNQAMRLVGIADPIAHIARLVRALGIPKEMLVTRTLLMPQLDLPTLIMCPRELEFPERRNEPHVHYAEAGIDLDRAEPPFPWERLDEGKKLIYCSLGSVLHLRNFNQAVIDAVSREPGWQLVMNIGSTLTPADFHGVLPSAILVNDAPQLSLLRRAAAMITHGGASSVKECVYFGVPIVVCPAGFDQPGNAARVRYHGLGVMGSLAATPDQIHELVSQVLRDEQFSARARAMAAVFQARKDAHAAVTTIEQYLAG